MSDSKKEAGSAAAENKPKRLPRSKKEPDWGNVNRLVKDFALIYGTTEVWDGVNRIMMSYSAFEKAVGADLVKQWNASQYCRKVLLRDVLFAPGKEVEPHQINLYDGLKVERKKGDPSLMLELLSYLCSEVSAPDDVVDDVTPAQMMHWILCWLALPLQKIGTKMTTALLFHGDEGAGKNLFFEAVRDIYGDYGVVVGQDQLDGRFNEWASMRLMVIGNEVLTRAEMANTKNKLKNMITEKEIQIEPKHSRVRAESNHMNIVFLSNELQPLILGNTDRRYGVVFTPPAREAAFYKRVGDWLDDENGLEIFYDYLMSYDIGDFTKHTKPPFTKAKEGLIRISSNSAERFVDEWVDGSLGLPFATCKKIQIYTAYQHWCRTRGERNCMALNRFVPEVNRRLGKRATENSTNVKEGYGGARKTVKFWHIQPTNSLYCPPSPVAGTPAQQYAYAFEEFEGHLTSMLKEGSKHD